MFCSGCAALGASALGEQHRWTCCCAGPSGCAGQHEGTSCHIADHALSAAVSFLCVAAGVILHRRHPCIAVMQTVGCHAGQRYCLRRQAVCHGLDVYGQQAGLLPLQHPMYTLLKQHKCVHDCMLCRLLQSLGTLAARHCQGQALAQLRPRLSPRKPPTPT